MVHLGIIPDGNRRWIKMHNYNLNILPYIWLNKIKDNLLNYIINNNRYPKFKLINEISIYICSIDNMNRDDNTKDYIYDMLNIFLKLINAKNNKTQILDILNNNKIELNDTEINIIIKYILELSNNIIINIIGDIELIPKYLYNLLEHIKILNNKNKKKNTKYTLNIAIAYDYKKDMENYGLKENTNNNYERNQSNIDILFRSGGEYRTSGFFPTKIIYSELFFNEKLWLDINLEDLHIIIEKFEKRNRRYGN